MRPDSQSVRHLPLGAPAQALLASRNPQETHNVLVDGQHVGYGLVLHEDPWFVLTGERAAWTVTDALTGRFIASDARPIKAVRAAYRRLLRHAQAEDRTPSGGVDWEAILDRARGAQRAGAVGGEEGEEEMNANERKSACLAEARAHGYQAALARLAAEQEWHMGRKARLYRERCHHERLMNMAEKRAYDHG